MKQKVKTGRKARQKVFGKRTPVVRVRTPDGKKPEKKPNSFLGSIVTPENHVEYRKKQVEHFIQRFTEDVISGREAIMKMEDKTPEEIEVLIEEYNSKQPDEAQLNAMAHRFATKMVAKESKHLKAYLQGKQFFNYNGQQYPVITEKMVSQTQSVHEILKQLEDAKHIREQQAESEDPLKGIGDIPEGDNQTIRSEPGDQQDPGFEGFDPGAEELSDAMLPNDSNNPG